MSYVKPNSLTPPKLRHSVTTLLQQPDRLIELAVGTKAGCVHKGYVHIGRKASPLVAGALVPVRSRRGVYKTKVGKSELTSVKQIYAWA